MYLCYHKVDVIIVTLVSNKFFTTRRKKFNESRNSHTHGSMPEIPSSTTGCYGLSENTHEKTTSPQPNKLTHSYSSDSILDKENVTSTPTNPSVYVM